MGSGRNGTGGHVCPGRVLGKSGQPHCASLIFLPASRAPSPCSPRTTGNSSGGVASFTGPRGPRGRAGPLLETPKATPGHESPCWAQSQSGGGVMRPMPRFLKAAGRSCSQERGGQSGGNAAAFCCVLRSVCPRRPCTGLSPSAISALSALSSWGRRGHCHPTLPDTGKLGLQGRTPGLRPRPHLDPCAIQDHHWGASLGGASAGAITWRAPRV